MDVLYKPQLTMNSLKIYFSLFVIVLSGCCAFPGMRLLTMEIYVDDKLVLSNQFDAPDNESAQKFWNRASRPAFSTQEDKLGVEASSEDPLRAELTGSIVVKIFHGANEMTTASLDRLILMREKQDTPFWYIAPGEVKRIQAIAQY